MKVATIPSTKRVQQELELIREQHPEGVLVPADVVEYARANKKSALHQRFTWDNNEAAREYRLEEARRLIRIFVHVVQPQIDPTRIYVSLYADRQLPGGGYRPTIDVMQDTERRAQLLEQALEELGRWQRKHRALTELSEIFAAAERTRRAAAERKAQEN